MTEFLRMSGVYWGVTALDLLGHLSKLNKDEIIDFIKKCQCAVSGGFSPCEGHDPHILYTLSAIQVVCTISMSMEIGFQQFVFQFSRFYAFTTLWMKLT